MLEIQGPGTLLRYGNKKLPSNCASIFLCVPCRVSHRTRSVSSHFVVSCRVMSFIVLPCLLQGFVFILSLPLLCFPWPLCNRTISVITLTFPFLHLASQRDLAVAREEQEMISSGQSVSL